MVPVTVDGETVRLEVRVYLPAGATPSPTLVFNHGSTGSGRDPSIRTRSADFPQLARFFVDRGWAVVMPNRRGRGGSDGLYDEGFGEDRARGYTCEPSRSIPGADRGLRDIDAAMDAILAMPFVDRTRVVIGGQSRGGILSVAYAAHRPELVKGVINFVGGWLYGDEDPFYALSHTRANFAVFQAAGGKGLFLEFPKPATTTGHRIIGHPELWGAHVEAYLKRRGF